MEKQAKIFIAGANGLVGSALVGCLQKGGYSNLLLPQRTDLDLTDQDEVKAFFEREKPEYIFLAAAKVGGIYANNTYPADFIYSNLMIQNNVIHQAYLHKVKRLLFLGSSCIYPRLAPQPMKEEHLLEGPLEPTNEPYAIAKIAGIKMCESYNRQYGTEFVAVMPTNLYGPGDNFHIENSHVLPALIRRFHEAKMGEAKEVVVWGSGTPMREFLYVDDMASGCLFVMQMTSAALRKSLLDYPNPCFFNLGTGIDISIRDLSEIVRDVVGYAGQIKFDSSKPDGTPRKLLDVSRITSHGWYSSTELKEGISLTYRWFVNNLDRYRVV